MSSSATTEQIKRLNNLTNNTVVQGWQLLFQKGAQPAPVSVSPPASDPTAAPFEVNVFVRQNSTCVAALLISFLALVAGIVGFGRKKGAETLRFCLYLLKSASNGGKPVLFAW